MLIEWSDDLSIGISEIDTEHRQLIEFANDFHEAVLTNDSQQGILEALNKILDYAEQHFENEEIIMERVEFPGIDEHREAHAVLLAQLSVLITDFQQGNIEEYQSISDFLQDWILQHLNKEDMMLGLWIRRLDDIDSKR